MPIQPNRKNQIKIELPPNLSATYANTVMISHTMNEVVFDFIQIMPNDRRARVQHRVVMTPAHAKMFLQAMQENVRRYEMTHGEVKLPPRPQSLADQLFKDVQSRPRSDEDDDLSEENEDDE